MTDEPIVWTCDEEDCDYTAQWQGLTLRAEALGLVHISELVLEGENTPTDYYYVGVYRAHVVLFHSGNHEGMILGKEMATGIAEAIAKGYAK